MPQVVVFLPGVVRYVDLLSGDVEFIFVDYGPEGAIPARPLTRIDVAL